MENVTTIPAEEMAELANTISSMMGPFSVQNLAILLGAGVGAAAGLVLLWFGFNFIKRKVMGALKKGNL